MLTSASSCKTMRVIWAPCRITPACAGNSSIGLARLSPAANHPRLRGEQYTIRDGFSREEGSPPLARGTDICGVCWLPAFRITPACAGNSKITGIRRCLLWDHPRLRGEQSGSTSKPRPRRGSPPLARGTGTALSCAAVSHGITPACAGNRFQPIRVG